MYQQPHYQPQQVQLELQRLAVSPSSAGAPVEIDRPLSPAGPVSGSGPAPLAVPVDVDADADADLGPAGGAVGPDDVDGSVASPSAAVIRMHDDPNP